MGDLDRLREEYESRKERLSGKNLYSLDNPTYSYAIYQRKKALRGLLQKNEMGSFTYKRVLEIGCGSGGVLKEYQELGVEPSLLYGIDLLFDRLEEAHSQLPSAHIFNVDGQSLPFPEGAFDLVIQYTAFSSVLDDKIKQKMASDMLRVLKLNGRIIWYDFWWNPTNRQTRGIRPKEVKALFPGCLINFKKITLAPPIARIVVPFSGKFASFLESLMLLNSHYLIMIKKN